MKVKLPVLDSTDLRILELLQENARISNADIARSLDMAPSGVLERVKKLEQKKVIRKYTVRLDPQLLRQNLLAFVTIRSGEGFGAGNTAKLLAEIPEVQEVHVIAGEDCYLVKIRTTDSAALMDLMRSSLAKIGDIVSTRTTIVMETVKEEQELVLANY